MKKQEQYYKVCPETGVVKPMKLPGINHGKGEDKGYPQQTKAKINAKNKK